MIIQADARHVLQAMLPGSVDAIVTDPPYRVISGSTVLDPFGGSGTTAGVALKHWRNAVLCELNPDYATMMPACIKAISGKRVYITPPGL